MYYMQANKLLNR